MMLIIFFGIRLMIDCLVSLFESVVSMLLMLEVWLLDLFIEIINYDEFVCDVWIGWIWCGDIDWVMLFCVWYLCCNFG